MASIRTTKIGDTLTIKRSLNATHKYLQIILIIRIVNTQRLQTLMIYLQSAHNLLFLTKVKPKLNGQKAMSL